MSKQRLSKWKKTETIRFLETLELYVSSGLPIDRALEISAGALKARRKKALLRALVAVESGSGLSRALVESIGIGKTTAGLIAHGEASGELAQTLAVSKSLLEREDELRKKCLSAVAYPAVIGCFALLLTIGLVRGVMPQIIPMLRSLHVDLPFLTRVVIAMSEGFLSYGLYVALGLGTITSSSTVLYRKSSWFRSFVHRIVRYAPIIGHLTHSYFLAVFLRSCGSLIDSGLPAALAYESTVKTISFVPLVKKLGSRMEAVSRGVPLGTIFTSQNMPPFVASLVNAGEVSGALGPSMCRAAAIIDRDLEHTLKRLTSLIEPVVMAGMGTVVGAIALSIMMPIYDISKVLQH